MAIPTPARRYLVRLGISMSIYVVALLAAVYLVRHQLVHGPALWLAALLPGLAIVGAFYAIGMLIVETKDEFVRMLLVRQVLYGTVVAMSVATVWGFLENFDLVPHLPAFYWAIVWFIGFGIGSAINRFTLGASGSCP
ncbi:MAG: hypothetical protein J2O44_00155 [Porphyrobacter sp.]|nr:hypothetical protein [Porphyrobacter sp.]